jgi:hypothetical protein
MGKRREKKRGNEKEKGKCVCRVNMYKKKGWVGRRRKRRHKKNTKKNDFPSILFGLCVVGKRGIV